MIAFVATSSHVHMLDRFDLTTYDSDLSWMRTDEYEGESSHFYSCYLQTLSCTHFDAPCHLDLYCNLQTPFSQLHMGPKFHVHVRFALESGVSR